MVGLRHRILAAVPLEDLACAALFAFFSMQGFIPGIAPTTALEVTGSVPTSLTTVGGIASQAVANGVILFLIARRPRLLLRSLPALPWVVLAAGLAIASTAWSLDPTLTLRRSIPFALAALFGLYFAVRFPASRQLAILRLAMIAVALATVALVVLAPSLALDHTPGHAADWQGVFTQKNACGRIMVLATAVILFGPRISPARAASLALFVFVLVMSGSRGAWIIEAAILLLAPVLHLAHRSGSRFRLLLGAAAPVVVAISSVASVLYLPPLLRLLGRDPTLSGRTAIWAQVAHFIFQRPWFGYGYDAFWRGMTGPSLEIDAAVHFIVEHAHNGFLEIALELGLAGLALFLASWFDAWRRLWPLWHAGNLAPIAFPIAFLLLIALYDIDENTLLIYNGIFWPLYVAALGNIAGLARQPIPASPRPSTEAANPSPIPAPPELSLQETL
ncbi:MAG TPA: O-antigen ligase family protein [Acidobacteriaceae bacterium]